MQKRELLPAERRGSCSLCLDLAPCSRDSVHANTHTVLRPMHHGVYLSTGGAWRKLRSRRLFFGLQQHPGWLIDVQGSQPAKKGKHTRKHFINCRLLAGSITRCIWNVHVSMWGQLVRKFLVEICFHFSQVLCHLSFTSTLIWGWLLLKLDTVFVKTQSCFLLLLLYS